MQLPLLMLQRRVGAYVPLAFSIALAYTSSSTRMNLTFPSLLLPTSCLVHVVAATVCSQPSRGFPMSAPRPCKELGAFTTDLSPGCKLGRHKVTSVSN